MKQAHVCRELSAVLGTEEAPGAGQCYRAAFPGSGHLRMKGMTYDHGLQPEKQRILSEAEPALPNVCTRPPGAGPVNKLCTLLAGVWEAGRARGICWVQGPGGDEKCSQCALFAKQQGKNYQDVCAVSTPRIHHAWGWGTGEVARARTGTNTHHPLRLVP